MKIQKFIPFFLFSILGLAVLGQLERVEFSLGRAMYVHECLLLLFVFLFFPLVHKKAHILKPFLWLNVWILLTILFHFFAQHVAPLTPLLYLARLDVYVAFGIILFHLIRGGFISRSTVWWFTCASIVTLCVLGWLQYVYIPDTRNLVYLGWDDHYLRMIGTIFDPGFLGAIVGLGALILQHKLFTMKFEKSSRFALLQWMWLLCVSALLFTYSRASFVAFACGTLFLFYRERKRGYIGILAFFSLAVLCLPRPASEGARLERTVSIVARVNSVQSGVSRLSGFEYVLGKGWYAGKEEGTHPVGGNQVGSHNSAPENSFIFILSSIGLVGLGLGLWCAYALLSFFQWRSEAVLIFVSMGGHAFFSNTLFYPFVLLYAAALLATLANE